jgi:hypothetical protein
MSKQAAQLLEAFEALPEEEKRLFTVEVLRRVPFDSGPLDDSETALAADRLFSDLEADENDAESR